MLALTETATEAVETIIAQPLAPDNAVLRITVNASTENGNAASHELQLALVDSPADDDLVVQGAPVTVEPATAEFLDDKVLDAEFVDGGVQFSLYPQP
jgi:Fe-S cluster assembly iron-binding protein IscA